MNTKFTAIIVIFTLFFLSACATTGSGNGFSLADAIEQSAQQIASDLPVGTRLAVVSFETGNEKLSNYIMEELAGALFDRNLEVAERGSLEYVYQEQSLQLSGNVSDETALSIGKFVGAEYVVVGQFTNMGSTYRFTANTISVERATRASNPRFDVSNDREMRNILSALNAGRLPSRVSQNEGDPKSAGTFFDRGVMFMERQDWDLAIADFGEAVRLNPNFMAAYQKCGNTYMHRFWMYRDIADVDRAIAEFTEAIRLVPDNSLSFFGRGQAYLDKEDFDKAIADFGEAIRFDPKNVAAYSDRGLAYWRVGDYTRSMASFDQAIRIDRNSHDIYHRRGLVYMEMGELDLALADYNQAVRQMPDQPWVFHNRGLIYFEKKDFDRAIADFSEAIRIDPYFNANIYFDRGIAYREKRDFDRAIADFSQFIRMAPDETPWVYVERGYIYLDRRDYDNAISDFEAALRIDPDNSNAKDGLERAQRRG